MAKKKKRIKKRNGYAKALESPTHKQKVIPNKKKNAKSEYDDFLIKVKNLETEYESWEIKW